MNRNRRLLGMAVASAAAGLLLAGAPTSQAAEGGTVKVKCYGANSCKGQAECKTAMNSCKGHNACKGRGFVTMDEASCIAQLGRS